MSDRFLLDTSIVTAFSRPESGSPAIRWLDRQASRTLFIASVVLGEVWQGVATLPEGRKKRELAAWFAGPAGPQALFGGRILPLDEAAAVQWAEYIAEGRRAGRPRSPIDMQIAAIAKVNGCALVTSDLRDFEPVRSGLALLDPTML